MSAEENKATFRRYVEEDWAKGNVEVADEVFADRYIAHQPDGSEEQRGPEDVKQFLRQYREAFPDLQILIEDQIAEGDKVVTRWASRGTHRGEFRGISPTGNEVSLTGIGIFRFSEGKVGGELGQLRPARHAPTARSYPLTGVVRRVAKRPGYLHLALFVEASRARWHERRGE